MGRYGVRNEIYLISEVIEPFAHVYIRKLKREPWVNNTVADRGPPPYEARYSWLLYFADAAYIQSVVPVAFKVAQPEQILIDNSSNKGGKKEKCRRHYPPIIHLRRAVLIAQICGSGTGIWSAVHKCNQSLHGASVEHCIRFEGQYISSFCLKHYIYRCPPDIFFVLYKPEERIIFVCLIHLRKSAVRRRIINNRHIYFQITRGRHYRAERAIKQVRGVVI